MDGRCVSTSASSRICRLRCVPITPCTFLSRFCLPDRSTLGRINQSIIQHTAPLFPPHYPILPPYPHALESWAPAYRLQPCRQGMQRLAAVTERQGNRQVNYITGHPLYLVASTGFIFFSLCRLASDCPF